MLAGLNPKTLRVRLKSYWWLAGWNGWFGVNTGILGRRLFFSVGVFKWLYWSDKMIPSALVQIGTVHINVLLVPRQVNRECITA